MTCNSGRTKNLDGSPNERSLNVDPAAIIDGENRHSLSHACCSGLTFCRWRHLFPDLTDCALMSLHGCRAQIGGFQILKIGSSSHLLGRSQPHRGKHHLQVERSAILTFEFYMSYIHAKHSVMCHLEPDKNVLLTTPVSESSSESVASMNDVSRLNRGETVKKVKLFQKCSVRIPWTTFCDDFQPFSHTFVLLEI